MSRISVIEDFPKELQAPMARTLDAFERDLSKKLALRQDIDDLRADFGKAQKRNEKRFDRLEMALVQLAEAQKRTEDRLGRLEIVVAELAEAQKRTEDRLADLTITVKTLTDRQAKLIGAELERNYRNKSHAYLGTVMRRVRPVVWQDIEDVLDAHLSNSEINELGLLDVMLRRRLRDRPDTEIWLAIEVSYMVDRRDVERALQRAALLRKVGYRVIPVAAGESVTMGAKYMAEENKVFLLQNGKKFFWKEALKEALTN